MMNNKFFYTLAMVVMSFLSTTLSSEVLAVDMPRERINIDFDWQFKLGDHPKAKEKSFVDTDWRTLNVPHDWSIEGEYKQNNPAGIAGGFLPTGTGWYRKHLNWHGSWSDKRVMLEFDGVYMNSEVWVNGHSLGKRPYGYISFSYDITDYLNQDNNVIAVRVDNSKAPSGRWYTGSGIYRHVWLTTVSKQHIPYSGVFVRSDNVSSEQADVIITTEINNSESSAQSLTLLSQLLDDKGLVVAQTSSDLVVGQNQTEKVEQAFKLVKPSLWSTDEPNLYLLKSTIILDGKVIDVLNTSTGFRSIEFTADRGFVLNGKSMILQGVSMHHDAGPVGAAVPDDVLRKRLETLKDMGVNAIRTTHNPFAPEFYQMADEMGFVLMNEAFDGWWDAKAEYDYGLYFDKWWQTDLRDFIRRDRNHPSVIMWSVGNEVPKYKSEQQKRLVNFVKQLDDTRPITQGGGYAGGHLSIAGFNGHGEFKGVIEKFHQQNPEVPVIGTEMTHTIHTRGVYRTKTAYRVRDFPAPWETCENCDPKKKWRRIKSQVYDIPDLTEEEVFPGIDGAYGSSFDNSVVRMPIRDEIKLARDLPYFLGTFRWTAFDYLGESFGWPARTANFGVIDLAGFTKGPYYLYQSQWTSKPMVHLDPHWTHPGKEGVEIPVVVYTNQESAELFLNGKSLGEKTFGDKDSADEMQLVWLVPYQAGELTVVAKSAGNDMVSKTIHSAEAPHSIAIIADQLTVVANQTNVIHLTLDVVDKYGNFVPEADNRLRLEIDGPATLIGVENGDILDLEPHKVPTRKAFMGKVLALIQTTDVPGTITISVSGVGLQPQQIVIESLTNIK
jgi:beta-galactosidase